MFLSPIPRKFTETVVTTPEKYEKSYRTSKINSRKLST